jgi:cysteine desulfuration protein SufE
MSLADRKAALLAELEPFADHHERFQYIIDRAKTSPALPADLKLDIFLIEGCTSNLWLVPKVENGKCFFWCDADSLITKGIATLVCDLYNEATPAEVAATDSDFLSQVGITQHLSPNRRNGLTNLVSKIRGFGRAALTS